MMADLDLDALGILQADRLVITLTLRGRHLLEEREICRLRIRCNDDRFRAVGLCRDGFSCKAVIASDKRTGVRHR